ncbi:hypothetical protein MPOCJGCO_2330 [Methylobacterium trifolii]|uniref:Zinc finger/thioredoxin putative domain-containing protein n=2 Tax=Methylobacterium trifolii TaxID=1003092 RepID=A0ABQ4TZ81_9HYPH|nr:zinc-ribbon domain-containing protein [Methylobacterium trifolii]GJE60219.1 hypothetical protein MPOCJGCO_2330 [Methylobacterium trifolii]
MLIVCPTCASEYRIDAERVGMEGRSVRCAACRETWFITPADVLAARAAELDAAQEAEALSGAASDADWKDASAAVRNAAGEGAVVDNVPPRPRPKPARGRPAAGRRKGVLGLSPVVAAGLAVLAALPLACLARAGVVRAMPQTAGLYARIGLPVNLRGIEIRDVVAFRNPAEDGRTAELVVEGDLVGVAKGDAPVPPLAVAVRDGVDRTLRTLAIPAPRAVLASGETARFRTVFPDPPAQGRSLEVRFAEGATPAADASRH